MIRERLYKIAIQLVPGLERLPESDRYAAAGYFWRALFFIPPTLIGLVWLISVTDPDVFRDYWAFLLVLLAFLLMFSTLWLEMYFMTVAGSYRSERRSFWGESMWSGVLVLGPTVAWLGVLLPWINFGVQVRSTTGVQRLRLFSQSMFRTSVLLPTLVEVTIYQRLGGRFPLPSLQLNDVLPAVVATLLGFTLGSLMIAMSQGISRIMSPFSKSQRAESLQLAVLMALIGPAAGLVAILPAGLYSLVGWGGYFSFQAVMLIGTFIIDRLSRTVESVRRRTRELEQIQQLGQVLLQTTPDNERLTTLLETHVPAIFPLCNIAIRLYPDVTLLVSPRHWEGPDAACWDWEIARSTPLLLRPRDLRPWQGRGGREGVIVMPILGLRSQQVLGRLYLHREERIATFQHLLPAIQWLADQIASAHHNAELYRQTLVEQVRQERLAQELAFARSVQASFLPTERPQIAGWQIAATLEPARETSGDFFDLIPLHGGLLGVVIADVADKGMGAALYMALSRTLLRAYAIDYALRYSQTYIRQLAHLIQTVNLRMVTDTKSDQFVTLFFGVLDPKTGNFTYVNAGHNPPYLFPRHRGRRYKALRRTGLPLGVLTNGTWKRRSVKIESGDTLVLYTDGLTEATNAAGDFFGDVMFERAIRASLTTSAEGMCNTVLRAVTEFEGDTPRADDITLMILRREVTGKRERANS